MRNRIPSFVIACLLIICLPVSGFGLIPAALAAGEATMEVTPGAGVLSTARDFSLDIVLHTGSYVINAARAELIYDPGQLTLATIDGSASVLGLEAPTDRWTTPDGKAHVYINRSSLGGGQFSGDGLMARTVFHARVAGSLAVTLAPTRSDTMPVGGSLMLTAAGSENVLSSTTSGLYTLVDPGVALSASILDLTEGGPPSSYTVALLAPPSGNVSIAVSGDIHVLAVPSLLTFTTATWNVPQTVTVAAVDDAVAEGLHHGTVTHMVTSADPSYGGMLAGAVTVNITDNDHSLSSSVSSGSGTISRSPDQLSYPSGTVVTLTATPARGFSFTGWSGDVSGTVNPVTVTMDGDKTVTAAFTEGPVSSLITHYYTSLLDRSPEESGRLFWLDEITRTQSLGIDTREGFIALARFFLTSPEYQARNTTNAVYVTDLYETFFNRTPAPSEVTYWTDLMTAGMSRDITMNWFVYSSEYATYMTSILGSSVTRPENNLVNDLYRGFLNRLPDTGGFTTQLTAMRTAQASDAAAVRSTTRAIALNFVNSPEYALRARTDAQFIEDCYNGILRRGALASEIQGWVDLLTRGASRTEVLTGFVDSPEFQLRVNEVIAAGPYVP